MINHSRWSEDPHSKFHAALSHGIIRLYEVQQLLLVLLLLSPATPCVTAQSSKGSSSQYPYSIDADFNPSMTIIVAVLVCALFFISFFSIYVRQCVDSSNVVYSQSSASAHNRSPRPERGLEPSVIESFPIFVYSAVKELKIGKGALECAVCIAEFEDSDTLRLLPGCDHVFHPDCIDAWLASQSTCPVCRADLTPNDAVGDTKQIAELDSSVDRNSRSDLAEVQNRVSNSINADEDRTVEMISPKQNRRVSGKFPRSHSTGHSLVQPGENCERYTLRLPEEVRKGVLTLKRTTSCVVVFPTEESSRMGYRSGGEGSSRGRRNLDRLFRRSDWWVFTMTPPFFARTGSSKSPKIGAADKDLPAGNSKMVLTSVKTPFDCIARKSDGVEQLTNRPPV